MGYALKSLEGGSIVVKIINGTHLKVYLLHSTSDRHTLSFSGTNVSEWNKLHG